MYEPVNGGHRHARVRNTSFRPENGWLAVIRRLFRSYLSAISSNSTLVSAWSFRAYDRSYRMMRSKRSSLASAEGSCRLLRNIAFGFAKPIMVCRSSGGQKTEKRGGFCRRSLTKSARQHRGDQHQLVVAVRLTYVAYQRGAYALLSRYRPARRNRKLADGLSSCGLGTLACKTGTILPEPTERKTGPHFVRPTLHQLY
jgi:hypothetical protein